MTDLSPGYSERIFYLRRSSPCFAGSLNVYEWEAALLHEALKRAQGNRTHTAKILGLSLRSVRNWIHRYGEPLIE